jgi:hypothetical protein
MLNGIYGDPIAIALNRNGRVFSIHTGFAGPPTGRHYEEHVKEFRDPVEQLLTTQGYWLNDEYKKSRWECRP